MFYGDCTLLLYRKYFKIFKAAINPTHAGLCSKGYAALVMQKLLRVYGRHLVIKKEKKRVLDIFEASKTYRSPIIIQCG